MTSQLKSESRGRTMVLAISNPDMRNALDPVMYAAGVEALNAADRNPDVRSVILTGEGSTFCAGGNLQRLQASREKPREAQERTIDGLHAWVEAIRTFPKPVIAAVEGAAAGAGFSLALACDFIVAADNAVFVMAYSSVALSPDAGGTWSLAHAMPRQVASEIAMCGEKIGAERLRQLGVVNRVVGPGEALEEALKIAENLNARAPNALASVKELLSDAPGASLTDHLKAERRHFVDNLFHANGGIGISAFLGKRKPEYE